MSAPIHILKELEPDGTMHAWCGAKAVVFATNVASACTCQSCGKRKDKKK